MRHENIETSTDLIDDALNALIDDFCPEDMPEEEYDFFESLFLAVYADMVDDEIIPQAPTPEVDDIEKQQWVDLVIPQLKQAVRRELDANSSVV